MKYITTLLIWIITFMAVWSVSAKLLSKPSDFLMLLGLGILLLFALLSYWSKCFTRILDLRIASKKKLSDNK